MCWWCRWVQRHTARREGSVRSERNDTSEKRPKTPWVDLILVGLSAQEKMADAQWVEPPTPWNELSIQFVRMLINMKGSLPIERLLPPSRFVLLQAYDACHTRAGGKYTPCALQQVLKGRMWTPQERISWTIKIFRKLTGDTSTPDAALSNEAMAIARKRGAAHNTPSAAMRRWLAEKPLAITQRALGTALNSSPFASKTGFDRIAPTEAVPLDGPSPGPGEYNLDTTDLSASVMGSQYPHLHPNSSHLSASFATKSPRASAALEPAWLSGPLKPTPRGSFRCSAPQPEYPDEYPAPEGEFSQSYWYPSSDPHRNFSPSSPSHVAERRAPSHRSYSPSAVRSSPAYTAALGGRPTSAPPSRPGASPPRISPAVPSPLLKPPPPKPSPTNRTPSARGGSPARSHARGGAGLRSRESSRAAFEQRSLARLQEAEQRAAAAMAELQAARSGALGASGGW